MENLGARWWTLRVLSFHWTIFLSSMTFRTDFVYILDRFKHGWLRFMNVPLAVLAPQSRRLQVF